MEAATYIFIPSNLDFDDIFTRWMVVCELFVWSYDLSITSTCSHWHHVGTETINSLNNVGLISITSTAIKQHYAMKLFSTLVTCLLKHKNVLYKALYVPKSTLNRNTMKFVFAKSSIPRLHHQSRLSKRYIYSNLILQRVSVSVFISTS